MADSVSHNLNELAKYEKENWKPIYAERLGCQTKKNNDFFIFFPNMYILPGSTGKKGGGGGERESKEGCGPEHSMDLYM